LKKSALANNSKNSDHAGPLAGILAGLDWMTAHAPHARMLLSVAVDGPFLPSDLAARLSSAAMRDAASIACAASGSRRHGVYALWSPLIRDDLRHRLVTDGLRKVDDWLTAQQATTATWPTAPFDPFFNINTPEDLAEAERILERFPNA